MLCRIRICGQTLNRLINLQGEQPHCGFPEVNYLMHAERLVRAGLRVVVVEQTETPDMLRIRNEQRPAGQSKVARTPSRPLFRFLACYC